MKRFFTWLGFAAAGALLLGALAAPAPALAHSAEGGASADDIRGLLKIVFWMAVPVFLLVEGLIVYAIIRYRRRRHDEVPAQVEGHAPLEFAWTILAFVIVAVLFVLTLRALQTGYEVKAENETADPDLLVRVDGYMFNWDYTYFLGDGTPTGVISTKRLTVPAARNVLLEIGSRDVQHSFWLPDLAGKVDAIPGRVNTMWLRVPEPGMYQGNCAEYCGTLHYAMLIELEALPADQFATWLAERESAAGQFVPIGADLESPLPQGDAARGAGLFTDLGCGNCHGAQGGAGPTLTGMGERAAHRVDGLDATRYLRESILAPCDYEVEGFGCRNMPATFGDKLDAQGLADLIAYLLTQ